jgi:hypothetical protein
MVTVPYIATNEAIDVRELVEVTLLVAVQSRHRHLTLHGEGISIPKVQELRSIAHRELLPRCVVRNAPSLVIRRRRPVLEFSQLAKFLDPVYEAGTFPPGQHDQPTIAIRVPVIGGSLAEVSIVHIHREFHLERDGIDPAYLRLTVQSRRFVHLAIVAIRKTLPAMIVILLCEGCRIENEHDKTKYGEKKAGGRIVRPAPPGMRFGMDGSRLDGSLPCATSPDVVRYLTNDGPNLNNCMPLTRN